jgi:hypothetical protein
VTALGGVGPAAAPAAATLGRLLATTDNEFRRLSIAFAKNYFNYATGGAVNQGRPPRAASNIVAEAVFDALGLQR